MNKPRRIVFRCCWPVCLPDKEDEEEDEAADAAAALLALGCLFELNLEILFRAF